jgi:S1-C subfamily serine protease
VKTTLWLCILSAGLGSVIAVAIMDWYAPTLAQTTPAAFRIKDGESGRRHRTVSVLEQQVPPRQFTADEMVGIDVYEKVNRSVVNIQTSTRQIEYFQQGVPVGSGSGWVYDKSGHIVTNNHVIADSDSFEVTLFDGQTVSANVVGTDPANDIAVLRITVAPESLVPVDVGESSTLRVGQRVYAIGNPFGLERTMTEGIISSLNRTLRPESNSARLIHSIIQTDAALNQGSSGGPLLDSQGLLIGMNTAIATGTGENTGIGFAISANTIARTVPVLIRDGRVIRPSLGIATAFPTPNGVGIHQLIDDGPAEKAGLRAATWIERIRVPGGILTTRRSQPRRADTIVAINDVAVRTPEELLTEVDQYKPGDRIRVRILREGRPADVTIVLTEE